MQPELAESLAILSAMITPAVLISACGSLTISTSNRLSRAVDRTRKLSEQFERPTHESTSGNLLAEQSRIAVGSIYGEMRFLRRMAQHYTPAELKHRADKQPAEPTTK